MPLRREQRVAVAFQIAPTPKKPKNSIENQSFSGWFFFFQSEPNDNRDNLCREPLSFLYN